MCQVVVIRSLDDSAMAVAMSPVFSRKYTVAAPTSGRAIVASAFSGPACASSRNASPAPWTVTTSDAMLNSVRYSGLRSRLLFRWHWANALAAATTIVSCGPSSSSDAKSTAYDTDIVDPLVVSGSVTFRAAAADDSSVRTTKSSGSSTRIERGG